MAEQHVERRLAAVLAADVVGYSRLMASDEDGTLARLKMCSAGNSWNRRSRSIVAASSNALATDY